MRKLKYEKWIIHNSRDGLEIMIPTKLEQYKGLGHKDARGL